MRRKFHKAITGSLILIVVLSVLSACTKFVQIDPPTTAITGSTVYSNNNSAAAAMTSVYDNMTSNLAGLSGGYQSISLLMGLAGDELTNYDPTILINSQFYTNALSSFNSNGSSNYYFWTELYNQLYVCNAVLAGLESSTAVSASTKQQITGEAKFMRAFLNFYATNLYGDIPLVSSTNYLVNNTLHRTLSADVYRQIIEDLKDAQSKLSDNFLDASGGVSSERVRPNKGAATALLARAYLYIGAYDSAETQASAVINNGTSYVLDSNLDEVFLANSQEAIWQLQSIMPGNETLDGQQFVLTSTPGSGTNKVALRDEFLNVFETGDARYDHWIGAYTGDNSTYYYFPYKYKIVYDNSPPFTEYTMVLRLAEQYLIRAEARAKSGILSGPNSALSDLDIIRNRALLANYSGATDQASVLAAILHERRVELFTEWGHRWFDLKRTDSLNAVMTVVTPTKGGSWNPDWAILPIPLAELKVNSNLTQNPGY